MHYATRLWVSTNHDRFPLNLLCVFFCLLGWHLHILIFNYSTGLQWSNRGRKKHWRKLKIDQPESVTETVMCKVLGVLSVSTGGDELK